MHAGDESNDSDDDDDLPEFEHMKIPPAPPGINQPDPRQPLHPDAAQRDTQSHGDAQGLFYKNGSQV